MFNDSMQGISVLTYSLFNSSVDIIKENTFETVVNDRAQFISTEGDIYFPMGSGVGFDKEHKLPTFMKDGSSTTLDLKPHHRFSDDYIDKNITTIAYNKSIHLPTLLKRLALDEKTYGVIIQNPKSNYMINPLHPAIAFAITSGMMEYPDEGELHIFEWSSSALAEFSSMSTRKKNKELKFYEEEYQDLFKTFPHVIKKPITETRTASISENSITRLIESPLVEDIDIQIDIQVSSGDSNLTGIKSVLIPTQLAIGNMAQPYYGYMHLTNPTSGSIEGYNMSPMMSGNLQQGLGNDSTDEWSDLLSNTSDGNVCCGSSNSSTPRGWSTLSKINLNSMFSEYIISYNGLMSYVEVSKKIAGTIWEGIEKEAQEKLKEIEDTSAEAVVSTEEA